MRGAVAHDVKHQLVRAGILMREDLPVADAEFHYDLVTDGMWGWRARLWVWALGKFGAKGVPSEGKEEYAAP